MNPALSECSTNEEPSATKSLLRLSSVVYMLMSLTGLAVMFFFTETWPAAFVWPSERTEILRHAGLALVAALLLLTVSANFEWWFPSYRSVKSQAIQLLGSCSLPAGIYLALASAIGEEIFFRGAVQPFIGVWFTSALFGLIHIDQEGGLSAWSFWACLAGIVFGTMVLWTGNLWLAIIAHFLVNLTSLMLMRLQFQRQRSAAEAQAANLPST